MKKSPYLLPVLLVVLGLICIIVFSLIGSSVDRDGVLREPFALLPIGYLFLGVGIVTAIMAVMKKARTQPRN